MKGTLMIHARRYHELQIYELFLQFVVLGSVFLRRSDLAAGLGKGKVQAARRLWCDFLPFVSMEVI